MKNGWTGGQYSAFRIIFGTYLFIHFVHLAPWAAELFSHDGALPDGRASPLLWLFPNILAVWDGPIFATALVIGAAALSVLFAVGWFDRLAAVLVWYIWACLHGRMPLIANPGLPYIGWLLLAHACLPPAPYGSWAARTKGVGYRCLTARRVLRTTIPDPFCPSKQWRMPEGIFLVAWILMAVGYSYSGATKLVSPSWLDGTAVARVLDNPLARPGWPRDALLALPPSLLHAMTWGALLAELLFAPLALVPRLRPWLWGMLLSMHLGLILVIDFADLSLGMVMVHGFTFDPGWLRSKPR